jgi:hypothetical protein
MLSIQRWQMTDRYQIWDRSLAIFWQKPLLGFGQDNLGLIYRSVIREQDKLLQQIFVDKAHNGYLELLATTGILGFLTWLSVVGYVVLKKLKTRFDKKIRDRTWTSFLLLAVLFYLLVNFFNLNGILLDGLFWTVLALLAVNQTNDEESKTSQNPKPNRIFIPAVLSFCIVSFFLIGLSLNLDFFAADLDYKKGLSASNDKALLYYQRSVTLAPWFEPYRLKLFDHYLDLAKNSENPDGQQQYYQLAGATLPDQNQGQSADYYYRLGQLYEDAPLLFADSSQKAARYHSLAHERAPFKY